MVIANMVTMGADLLAMGAAIQLLTGVKFVYWIVPLAAVMACVTIFLEYRVVSKYLLWLVAVVANRQCRRHEYHPAPQGVTLDQPSVDDYHDECARYQDHRNQRDQRCH